MPAPHLIIAAGGTGGHMFPAQALAEALVARGWRVSLSTDSRGARYAGGYPAEVDILLTGSATPARGGALERALVPLRIAGGIASALWRMARERPAIVAGFGGYPSIPALAAASALRLPRMIHEQNAVLGRVNARFASRVDVVACGAWPTALPEGAKGMPIGNPVRASILERAAAAYIPPGDYPTNLLVIGGSQGARILSDLVPEAVAMLPERQRRHLRIAHQARAEDEARVTDYYHRAGITADVQTFFTDIPARIADAQLVVSRAGASSVADLCVIGRPSILVPFAAAAGDHQSANARILADADAAIIVPERRATAQVLSEQIAAVLQHPDAAVKMAHGALAQGRPDATDRLVDLVENLAKKGQTT